MMRGDDVFAVGVYEIRCDHVTVDVPDFYSERLTLSADEGELVDGKGVVYVLVADSF